MAGKRKLPDFIDAFLEYAWCFSTTKNYHLAAAIWLLGTASLRQIGMRARGDVTYPNLYIQMIGNPGAGKSQTIKAVRRVLFPAVQNLVCIPASVTRAGLEDYMIGNIQQRKSPSGAMIMSSECIGLSEEMQGILPDQDLGHLTLYNELYDLPRLRVARTRTNGEVRLEECYASILTGAQPAFLATVMPEQAWGMGFMARSIMIYDQPGPRRSVFEAHEADYKLEADLIHDLRQLNGMHGWFKWENEARRFYESWWVDNKGAPVPQAKRLAMGYNVRRELQFLKFAMICSLSRGNDLTVTVQDAKRALQFLLTFEGNMRYIFADMNNTGTMIAIQDVLDIVRAKDAEDSHVDEAELINLLMQRMPSTQVNSTIENLVTSNALGLKPNAPVVKGFRKFVPGSKLNLM